MISRLVKEEASPAMGLCGASVCPYAFISIILPSFMVESRDLVNVKKGSAPS
ncbi:MAG: hypothetical protein ACP5HK_07390 [Acidilobus sp.]